MRVLSPLLFNLLVDSFATSLRAAVPGVRLVDSDPFRHVCQLYADDLVLLAEPRPIFSMLWTSCIRGVFVGGSRLVLAPPSRRLWSSVLSAAATIVPCTVGASLSLWCHNTSTSVSLSLPLFLGVLTLTWSPFVVIASSTKFAPGVVAKVCLSLSPHLSSLFASFPVRHLVWSSSVTTPQHFSFTGSLPLAMHSALPSDVHSLCLVACVPWTSDLFQSHILGSPSSAVRRWLSREAIPRMDRDLRLRLAAMASDLHGVRVDVSSDGRDQVWPNPSLAKTKFGQDQVWPDQVWPRPRPSGTINIVSVFVKACRSEAGDAFTQTRLMSAFRVSTGLHVEHRLPKAGDAPHEGLLKSKGGGFRRFGV